jgi:lipoprotein NlpI
LLNLAAGRFYADATASRGAEVRIIDNTQLLSQTLDSYRKADPGRREDIAGQLAQLFANRGRAYSEADLHVLSWHDYSAAARLEPDSPQRMLDEAIELVELERSDQADALFRKVLNRTPDDVFALRRFAWSRLDQGDYRQAVVLARQAYAAAKKPRQRAYSAVIEVLAARDRAALPAADGTLAATWPYPVAAYLHGAIDADALRAAVTGDSGETQPRLCEALFYLGKFHELREDRALAMRYYNAALNTRVISFFEYGEARRALLRLQAAGGRDTPQTGKSVPDRASDGSL